MKIRKIPCDSVSQEKWANFYCCVAKELIAQFGVQGRASVRDAIRMYARALGSKRRMLLLDSERKLHLKNIFENGGPLPCGEKTDKEWIRTTPQEVFVNVSACPYAACWRDAGDAEIGKMYCEEFYPEYVFSAASPNAQVNLGCMLTNDGDTFCRHSFYLRPTNLSAEERALYFAEFDPEYQVPDGTCPIDSVVYAERITLLMECFLHCAKERLGEDGNACVIGTAEPFLQD